MNPVRTVSRIIIFSTFFFTYNLLHAAGFYLSEVGTPGSLGTAGTANPTNNFTADSAWTNPAGMTGLKQDEMLSGLTLAIPKIEFESSIAEAGGSDGGNAGVAVAIPSFFYVNMLSDNTRFGLSVVAPLGGGFDFGDNFVGRYAATKTELQGVAISPSFAYKVNNKLSLGAGASVVLTIFQENIAINQGTAPDGKLLIEDADDWGVQFFTGLTYEINDRALIGIVYRSEMDTKLKGDVRFENMLTTPTANTINIDWTNPQLLEIGLRYKLDDEYTLFMNADWEDWSEFSKNRLAFSGGSLNPVLPLDRNFKDTWKLGVAVATKMGDGRIFTVGASYDSSPVDDADRTIDLPFDEVMKLSASYSFKGKKNLDYSIGGTLMYLGKGKIDSVDQGVRFKGEFDSNYILFAGGTLRYRF